jgi:phage terminase large subunit-like protein
MNFSTLPFYDLLLDHRIWHDGNEILSLHLRNCHAVDRGENGFRLRKGTKSSAHKIDGAIAAVMAVHQAAEPAPPARVGAFLV